MGAKFFRMAPGIALESGEASFTSDVIGRVAGAKEPSVCCGKQGNATRNVVKEVATDVNREGRNIEEEGGKQKPEIWQVRPSKICLGIQNPIRKLTDTLHSSFKDLPSSVDVSARKEVISLGQGDPTAFGHLKAADVAAQAVADAVASGKFNGYAPSSGLVETRRAIAEYFSAELPAPVDPENVFVTSGCGQALQFCFQILSNPGSNILLPRPGFPVYECYCQNLEIEMRYYDLLPERNWEVDCLQLDELMDESTAAILVCNPGNPSGAVFRKQHLQEIVEVAHRRGVPIISDEVYSSIVFSGSKFLPMASVAGGVPILTVSSLSKNFLVPGWRLGWIILQDPQSILQKARVLEALQKLLQFSASPCSLIQAAARRILLSTPASFIKSVNSTIEAAAELSYSRAAKIKGLSCPSKPQGSMFIMIKIDMGDFQGITDDEQWCANLFKEEAVMLIPGKAFGLKGWARIAITVPSPLLDEAWDRIDAFCCRHVGH